MDRTYANKSSINAKRMEDGEDYLFKLTNSNYITKLYNFSNYEFIKG